MPSLHIQANQQGPEDQSRLLMTSIKVRAACSSIPPASGGVKMTKAGPQWLSSGAARALVWVGRNRSMAFPIDRSVDRSVRAVYQSGRAVSVTPWTTHDGAFMYADRGGSQPLNPRMAAAKAHDTTPMHGISPDHRNAPVRKSAKFDTVSTEIVLMNFIGQSTRSSTSLSIYRPTQTPNPLADPADRSAHQGPLVGLGYARYF